MNHDEFCENKDCDGECLMTREDWLEHKANQDYCFEKGK